MIVEFTSRQRDQLELIALHTGRPVASVLTETAEFLLDCKVHFTRPVASGVMAAASQDFLAEDALSARLAEILGH